jgi:N-acetylneuraminic acid mutarotase
MKKNYFVAAFAFFLCVNAFATDTWTQLADFGGAVRHWAVGFSIGSKGYIGTGYGGGVYRQDVWEYDPTLNVWTQMANFGGGTRYKATAITIGSKAYVGTGINSSGTLKKDFWEFDPVANTWTAKTDFPGTARGSCTGVGIGTKGYLGTGNDGNLKRDWYEYDQATDTWITKASHPSVSGLDCASCFAIGTKLYVACGNWSASPSSYYMYEYDPATNAWTGKANVGGLPRREACAFSIGGKGYICMGCYSNQYLTDLEEYDPVTDGWVPKTSCTGPGRYEGVSFSIGSTGYMGTGITSSAELHDFYEWKDCNAAPNAPTTINGGTTICTGSSNNYSVPAVSGATSYTWTLPGGWVGNSVTNSINTTAGSTGGTFTISVTASNPCGTSTSQTLTVTVSVCSGINSAANSTEGILIYPNPFNDIINVNGIENGSLVEVYTILGEKIISTKANDFTSIDLGGQPNGIYFLKITSEKGSLTKQLIKQ